MYCLVFSVIIIYNMYGVPMYNIRDPPAPNSIPQLFGGGGVLTAQIIIILSERHRDQFVPILPIEKNYKNNYVRTRARPTLWQNTHIITARSVSMTRSFSKI